MTLGEIGESDKRGRWDEEGLGGRRGGGRCYDGGGGNERIG